MTNLRAVALATVVAGLLVAAAPAAAKVTVRSSLVTVAGGTRIAVEVAGAKPRAVTVKAGRRSYRLRRGRGRVWTSRTLRGAAGARLAALAGKRIVVQVRTRARTLRLRSRVAQRAGGEGGGGGGGEGGGGQQVDPKALAAQLITDQEFTRPFATQYTSGEELWRFCANGTFFYRYTSSGQYTTSESYGNGTWEIREAKTGVVQGVEVVEAGVFVNGTFSDEGQKQGTLVVGVSHQTTQAYLNKGDGLVEFIRGGLRGGC